MSDNHNNGSSSSRTAILTGWARTLAKVFTWRVAAGSASPQLKAKNSPAGIKLGQNGEKLACKYLKKQGYKHLFSNYQIDRGEIDLIMRQGKTIVFIEVKTRQNENFVSGEAVVNYHKQKHISLVARHFIHTNKLHDYPCRFDVIAVLTPDRGKPVIRHYENAFPYRFQ
jgi:putative endonuclease